MPNEFMTGKNHGTQSIDLSHITHMMGELRPVELHRKEDGAIDDRPSYCLVLQDQFGRHYYAELSEATLLDTLKDCAP